MLACGCERVSTVANASIQHLGLSKNRRLQIIRDGKGKWSQNEHCNFSQGGHAYCKRITTIIIQSSRFPNRQSYFYNFHRIWALLEFRTKPI